MKNRSKEEIAAIVNRVCAPEGHSWNTFDINIIKQTSNELLFEATHMYDWDLDKIPRNLVVLLAKEFGTDNIDKYDDIARSGCDTCDYGSKYGFAVRIWK